MVGLLAHSPFGEARRLRGFEGVAAFIVDYKGIVDSLASRSHHPQIVLENETTTWDERYRQIEAFFELL